MVRLDGKVAIITGAAQGQGRAEALLFAQLGARLVVTDLKEEVRALAAEIGEHAVACEHDVSSEAAWSAVTAAALERFGRVDVLVNNAGVFRPQSLKKTSAAEMEAHFRVNQLGVFLGMRAVADPMKATGGGSIINISSISGLRNIPGQFAYASTKWAMRGMSGCAAAELARDGVRVNTVFPGMIDTQMLSGNSPEAIAAGVAAIPLRRLGKSEEVAQAVAFLASDAASYITGAEISIDAGLRL